MPELSKIDLGNGKTILVQTADVQDDTNLGGIEDNAELAREAAKSTFRDLAPLADELKESVSKNDSSLKKLIVEIGIGFTGKGSLFVCSAEANAAIKVKMEYEL